LFGKKDEKGWDLTRLAPGQSVYCDLDHTKELRLPKLVNRIEDGDLLAVWLTATGLKQVLAGGQPSGDEIYLTEDLWKEEKRIGIARDNQTRKAEDHHLYTVQHIRPDQELEILVYVEGIPDEWHPTGEFGIPLGGEGRSAHVQVLGEEETNQLLEEDFGALPDIVLTGESKIRFTVSLITPGYYENTKDVIRLGPPKIPGECVSASIGKVMQLGGWNLKEGRPRPLLSLIPAGSTWFFEISNESKAAVEALHQTLTGDMQEYGMGEIVIGIWKEEGVT
jgi:CRISPR-associated protein Cmr3